MRSNHLSDERKSVVLGVDRMTRGELNTEDAPALGPIELHDLRRDEST